MNLIYVKQLFIIQLWNVNIFDKLLLIYVNKKN